MGRGMADYSMIEARKANGLDLFKYLAYLFTKFPNVDFWGKVYYNNR